MDASNRYAERTSEPGARIIPAERGTEPGIGSADAEREPHHGAQVSGGRHRSGDCRAAARSRPHGSGRRLPAHSRHPHPAVPGLHPEADPVVRVHGQVHELRPGERRRAGLVDYSGRAANVGRVIGGRNRSVSPSAAGRWRSVPNPREVLPLRLDGSESSERVVCRLSARDKMDRVGVSHSGAVFDFVRTSHTFQRNLRTCNNVVFTKLSHGTLEQLFP